MNIKKVFVIILISSTLSTLAEAKCAEVMGNMVVGKVTLGCANIIGSATFKASTFTGDLNITGPLKADSAKLAGLHVIGDITLNHSIVSSTTQVVGNITATDTTFKEKTRRHDTLNHTQSQHSRKHRNHFKQTSRNCLFIFK